MSAAMSMGGKRPAWVGASPQHPFLPVPRSLGMATKPCGDCAGGPPTSASGVAGELVPAAPTAACAMGGRRGGCDCGGRPPCVDAAVTVGAGRPPRPGAPAAGVLTRLSLPRPSDISDAAARLPTPPPRRRRSRTGSSDAFDLPRLAIPDVATAVAEHLNKPPRLQAVLRRLAAANAASHTSALAGWASDEEDGVDDGERLYRPSASPPHARPAHDRGGMHSGSLAPLLQATTRGTDGGLPAAVLPARILWRADVRLTVEAAAAAGRRQAGGDEADSGSCFRGLVIPAASTAWAATVRCLWEGGVVGKAVHAEDGTSWWLLLRAVVLVAFALMWMLAL